MNTHQFKRSIVRGFAWESGTRLVTQIVSWASTFLVARMLQPEDYGVVAISGVFTGLLMMIANIGLSAGLVNKDNVTDEERDAVFWLSLLVSVVLYALIYVASPYIAHYYDNELLGSIVRAAGVMLIFSSLNIVPMAEAARRLDFRFMSLVELVVQIITILFTLGLAYRGYGAWSLIVPVLIAQGFSVVAYFKMHTRIPSLRFQLSAVNPIIAFGATLMSSRILEFLSQRSATFVSGTFLGERQAGYYYFANNLAGMPLNKLGNIFQRIAFPALSSIKRQQEDPQTLFLKLHYYLFMAAAPALVGLALVAKEAVLLLVGDKWMPSVPILQALCYVNLLSTSAMLLPATLEACGKPREALKFQIASALVLPLAMYLGARYGINGMMYAWCIAYPFVYLYLLGITLSVLNLSIATFVRSCIPVFVGIIAMTVALYMCSFFIGHLGEIYILPIKVAVGIVAYAGSISAIFPGELRSIKEKLKYIRN